MTGRDGAVAAPSTQSKITQFRITAEMNAVVFLLPICITVLFSPGLFPFVAETINAIYFNAIKPYGGMQLTGIKCLIYYTHTHTHHVSGCACLDKMSDSNSVTLPAAVLPLAI